MDKRWKILFVSIFLLTLGPVAGVVGGHFAKDLFFIELEALTINTIPIGFLLGLMLSYFLSRLLRFNLLMSIFLLTTGAIIGVLVGYFAKNLLLIGIEALKITTTPIGFLLGLMLSYFLFHFLKWNWWASNNFCYTFVGEGRAKIIVKGRAYNKTLIQWTGYTINQNGKIERTNKKSKKSDLHFYGFWPIKDVYGYNFSWTDEKKTHAERVIDYILLKIATYIISVEKVEDKESMPLNIDFICQIRVENPYVALFNIQGWLQAITGRIKAKTREVISGKRFEDWLKDSTELEKALKEDSKDKKTGYYTQFGVSLELIKIKNINPSIPDHREAFSAQGKARLQAVAIRTKAEAERDRINMIAESFSGENVKLMRFLEALQGGNSNYVLPAELSELLKSITK